MNGSTIRRSAGILLAILVTSSAPSARAEITPEARAAVEKYVTASGGRALSESIRSTHLKARVSALGLVGTTEAWTKLPNHHATETLLGPFKISDGYDGAVAWRTDPATGKPMALDGKDLEDAVAAAYYDNERWLAPDQGGGKVTVAGVEKDSAGTYTVLEVTPPIGRSRRFYVNQKTGLVDRATSKRDQLELVSTFSDYRPDPAGRPVAYRQLTRVIGMPANDLTLEVDSLWVNEDLPDSRFALPGADANESFHYLKTPGAARLPFRYSGRHVWLTASVNGGPMVDFLFDTGASITVIDSVFAAKIGLVTEGQLQGQGAGAMGNATFSKVRSIRVEGPDGDGVEIADQKVAVLSINVHLAPFFWRDCAGVLGYDFISRFVSEIDFDKGTLALRDPKSFQYQGSGQAIPFTIAGTVPAIHMTLDGAYDGVYRVDVGSNSTVDLHGPYVKTQGLDRKVAGGIEVTGGGFGGTFSNRLVRMKSLAIGTFSWKNPMVSLSGAESGALASEDYAGNIGNQILERFKCTFDYERRVLYLEPSARYHEPDRFSRAGVQLARYGDEVKAMQVLPRSPAAKAGLLLGDRVIAIDGKPALSYTVDDLQKIFESVTPGRVVVLEVEHGDQRRKIEVKLATIL